jgi:hypothetical protein
MTNPLDELLAVDVAAIDAFVIDFVMRNPSVREQSDPVRIVMAQAMMKFKGGLNPIYLRPLVMARLYGKAAISQIVKGTIYQLEALLPFVEGDVPFTSAIEDAKGVLNTLVK